MSSSYYFSTVSSASLNTSVNMSEEDGTTSSHCHEGSLTGPYSIIVQAILAFIAFSFLILKRLREPLEERRPWMVWFFDTSKQALSAMFIHFSNIFVASAETSAKHTDPCSWYTINFLLDSTIGILIIYVAVKFSSAIIAALNCNTLRFGEYGNPPKWDAWFGQCAIYLLITLVEKTVIFVLASLDFFVRLARNLLNFIRNEKLELLLVMLVIPFVVNAIIFWVVDNFLMRKRRKAKKENSELNTEVHYRKKQNPNDGNLPSELEILLMDEEEISIRNGNHFAERI
ncbi:Store-operated calcium entry regulator STIMATE [Holothuria leucospilota]|uniref:Store-operated calcium entry regulator STIMATE n=1 Tax=Holothuria leucospilota TaxID=206669 RepID=A0A9Q1HJB6_HOLLE|nr:Store-operated calcium entry regulator STIMATE [Holothuria leucospilota]